MMRLLYFPSRASQARDFPAYSDFNGLLPQSKSSSSRRTPSFVWLMLSSSGESRTIESDGRASDCYCWQRMPQRETRTQVTRKKRFVIGFLWLVCLTSMPNETLTCADILSITDEDG